MVLQGDWNGTGRKIEIEVRDGRIATVRSEVDVPPRTYVAPGFLDIQVNGYRGLDYSSGELTDHHIEELVGYLLRAGTTRHVPTIVTNSQERITRNLDVIARAVSRDRTLASAIPAVHVEGPYISEEDGPRGAHDPRYVRDPSIAELDQWLEASSGLLRMVTVAPERTGALEFIRAAGARGVTVALGHTGAEPHAVREAVRAGARLSTHLGNGSHATIPRLRNYIWEQLAADELAASIISDGFHLPPAVMKVFARAKGLERLVLVSDVGPMGGCEPGIHQWGNIRVQVHEDGHLGLPGTEFLAGAGHLLNRGVVQFAEATGLPLKDVIPLCTDNPEAVLGLQQAVRSGQGGMPEEGTAASLVQFTRAPGADELEIQAAVNGESEWNGSVIRS